MKTKKTRMVSDFPLVEILIIVGILGIIVAIAVPAFLRARENAGGRRCQENLITIEAAVAVWALDFRHPEGTRAELADLVGERMYIKQTLRCPLGGTYGNMIVGQTPTCSIGESAAPYVPHVIESIAHRTTN